VELDKAVQSLTEELEALRSLAAEKQTLATQLAAANMALQQDLDAERQLQQANRTRAEHAQAQAALQLQQATQLKAKADDHQRELALANERLVTAAHDSQTHQQHLTELRQLNQRLERQLETARRSMEASPLPRVCVSARAWVSGGLFSLGWVLWQSQAGQLSSREAQLASLSSEAATLQARCAELQRAAEASARQLAASEASFTAAVLREQETVAGLERQLAQVMQDNDVRCAREEELGQQLTLVQARYQDAQGTAPFCFLALGSRENGFSFWGWLQWSCGKRKATTPAWPTVSQRLGPSSPKHRRRNWRPTPPAMLLPDGWRQARVPVGAGALLSRDAVERPSLAPPYLLLVQTTEAEALQREKKQQQYINELRKSLAKRVRGQEDRLSRDSLNEVLDFLPGSDGHAIPHNHAPNSEGPPAHPGSVNVEYLRNVVYKFIVSDTAEVRRARGGGGGRCHASAQGREAGNGV
jgi:hypothetical protein